ncbi:hypothetical protein [Nocardia sp. R6R-6]|uniref:hypothetical protein n=1 Tax=Nocardia sp. R6R-6 TaxID=3459303 RepID=UPI00403DA187
MTPPVVTKEDLDKAVDEFRNQFDEWKKMPDKINDTVNRLKWVYPAAWAYATGLRDDAQEKLKDLLDKLEEVLEGIGAPFTFVDYAAQWQAVAASVRTGFNEEDNPLYSLNGYWEGGAKERFANSKASQEKAMTSVHEMSRRVSTSLIDLAKSGLDLYRNIVDQISTYLTALAAAIEEVASVVLIYDGAPGMVRAVNDAFAVAAKLIGAAASQVQTQMIVANDFADVADNPWGLPGNKWPDALPGAYNNPKEWKAVELS